MLTTLVIVKLVAEIALMALVGRWVLGMIAGARRGQNLFYQVLDVMVRPFLWLARRLSPRMVIDRHMPLVAGLLLAFGWLAVTVLKIQACLEIGVQACR